MRNLVLSAFLLGSAFQTALGDLQDGDWTYYEPDNTKACITGYTGSGGAVTIPNQVNGLPVVAICEGAFYNKTSLTSVVIPAGVHEILSGAFWGCTGLSEITIPEGVTFIDDSVFGNCTNLKSVTIPSSVTSIGWGVFQGCSSLRIVVLNGTLSLPPEVYGVGQYELRFRPVVIDSYFINALTQNAMFVSSLASNEGFVTAVANKIKATGGNYGIATQSGVSNIVTATTSNLATRAELTASLAQSRTDGINSVLSNPNLWTLYTTNQIKNMAIGDLVLSKQVNGQFVLNYDIEQSEDLQTWTPYLSYALPMTNLPTDKAFVRIKAK